jgi:hypothetical protein
MNGKWSMFPIAFQGFFNELKISIFPRHEMKDEKEIAFVVGDKKLVFTYTSMFARKSIRKVTSII